VLGSAPAELATLRTAHGWLFHPAWPWAGLALLSAVAGAVLALGQRDVKRLLAFSTVSGAGFLVLGAAAGGVGPAGAVAGAAADALAKALLFSAVAAVEARSGPLTLARRGVAREHPLAAAAFLLGALAALGVPFTPGFAGHWRLYAAALDLGRPALALLIVATVLSVLAYVRVIALVWWGGTDDQAPVPADRPRPVPVWRTEPLPLVGALAGLAAVVLATGLLPRLLQDWVNR
jgi:NADH-quinone oxidoreductase subunit N